MTLAMESSDETFTAWQQGNLAAAARRFEVLLAGPAVFGWRLRSIGAPVTSEDGPRWVRVVSDYPEFASGDGWTGNSDANSLTGLAKPQVLAVVEWDDDGRRQRGELLTYLPGTPVSASDVLRQEVDLTGDWWAELRRTLAVLRATDTDRSNTTQDMLTHRARDVYGADLPIRRWETVHGDLHWNNLLAPRFGLLDWELWGRGPAGLDAASLYCHSLLVPTVASRVWEAFADVLDSDEGWVAVRAAAARMLHRITGGDYPELEGPLRQLTGEAAAGRVRYR
jgi:Ser/Thr protein kinase RdoA (MazF antagonist)